MSEEQAKAAATAVADVAKYFIRWAAGIAIGVFLLGWCVPALYRADAESAEAQYEQAYDLGYKTGLISKESTPGHRDSWGRPVNGPISPYSESSEKNKRWHYGYIDGQVVKAGMPKDRQ